MFCPKCGKEVGAGERFCGACGELLTETKENNITRKPDSNGKSRPSIIVWSIVAVLLLIVTGEVIALLRQRAEAAEREEMREERQRREEETQEERQRREEETQIQAQMDINDSAHGFKENVGQDNVVTQSEEGVDDETDFGEESTPPEEVTWTWIEYNPPEGDGQISTEGNEEGEEETISQPYDTHGPLERNDEGCVLFGRWEQDNINENGPEPIEWVVLEESDGRMLLWSRYILDCHPIDPKDPLVHNIDVWLNINDNNQYRYEWLVQYTDQEFYGYAFNADERSRIQKMEENQGEAVFILSLDEIRKYCDCDPYINPNGVEFYQELLAEPTDFALSRAHDWNDYYSYGDIRSSELAQVYDERCFGITYGSYWLREDSWEDWNSLNLGISDVDECDYVDYNGRIGEMLIYRAIGVRPAIWISVE